MVPNTPQSIQNFFFSLFNNFLHTLSWPSILTCSSRSTSLKFSFKISWTLLNSYLAHHPIIESHNSRLGHTDTTILPTYWSDKCTDKKCQVCTQRSKIPFFFFFSFFFFLFRYTTNTVKTRKCQKQGNKNHTWQLHRSHVVNLKNNPKLHPSHSKSISLLCFSRSGPSTSPLLKPLIGNPRSPCNHHQPLSLSLGLSFSLSLSH